MLTALIDRHRSIRSYRCLLDTVVVRGRQREERRYDYAFQQPKLIRMSILRGPNRGTTLMYRDGRVIARLGGLLGFVRKTFQPDDRMVTTIRGGRVDQTDFWFIISLILHRSSSCIFYWKGHEEIQGRPVDVLEVMETKPIDPQGYQRATFWVDQEARLFLQYELYAPNGELAFRQVHEAIEVNPLFPGNYFDL